MEASRHGRFLRAAVRVAVGAPDVGDGAVVHAYDADREDELVDAVADLGRQAEEWGGILVVGPTEERSGWLVGGLNLEVMDRTYDSYCSVPSSGVPESRLRWSRRLRRLASITGEPEGRLTMTLCWGE